MAHPRWRLQDNLRDTGTKARRDGGTSRPPARGISRTVSLALSLLRGSPRGQPGINLIVIDKLRIAAICHSHGIANRVGLPFVEVQAAFDCLNCERGFTAIDSYSKLSETA